MGDVVMSEFEFTGRRHWEAHSLGSHTTQGCPFPFLKPILATTLLCPGPSGAVWLVLSPHQTQTQTPSGHSLGLRLGDCCLGELCFPGSPAYTFPQPLKISGDRL